MTVLLASAVPENVGVVLLVALSLLLLPVSELLTKSGAKGADGAVESMVAVRPAEALLVLPAASVTLVVRVCVPSIKVLEVIVQFPAPSAVVVPSTVVPSVSYRVTVQLGSAPAPEIVGVLSLVLLSVLLDPLSELASKSNPEGADGAVVSKV